MKLLNLKCNTYLKNNFRIIQKDLILETDLHNLLRNKLYSNFMTNPGIEMISSLYPLIDYKL